MRRCDKCGLGNSIPLIKGTAIYLVCQHCGYTENAIQGGRHRRCQPLVQELSTMPEQAHSVLMRLSSEPQSVRTLGIVAKFSERTTQLELKYLYVAGWAEYSETDGIEFWVLSHRAQELRGIR